MYDSFYTMEEREKLYDEVWSEPVITVAQRYGISGNALKKRCMKIDVPVPTTGYWAKLKAGKPVTKTPLPKTLSYMAKHNLRGYALSYQKPLSEFTEEELHNDEPLFAFLAQTKELITKMMETISIQKQIRIPHKLIAQHHDILAERQKHERLERQYAGIYSNRPDEYYNFKNRNILKIDINKSRIHRAYCILQSLFQCVEELEGSISVTNWWNKDGGEIGIARQNWAFWMSEKLSSKAEDAYIMKIDFDSRGSSYWSNDHRSTYESLSFKDRPNQPLETQIGNMIYELMLKASRYTQKREIEDREYQKERAEEERQWELKKQRENEKKKLTDAIKEATLYRKAQDLRAFANAYMVSNEKNKDFGEHEREHYQWLLKRADWLDPLVNKPDELLLEEMKNEFCDWIWAIQNTYNILFKYWLFSFLHQLKSYFQMHITFQTNQT